LGGQSNRNVIDGIEVSSRIGKDRPIVRARLTAISAIAFLLAGCGGNPQPIRPSSGVQGVLVLKTEKGGEPIQVFENGPRAGRISVVRPDGSPVVSARTDRAGRFRIPLQPGRYSVLGNLLPSDSRQLYQDPAVPVPVRVTADGFERIRILVTAYLP